MYVCMQEGLDMLHGRGVGGRVPLSLSRLPPYQQRSTIIKLRVYNVRAGVAAQHARLLQRTLHSPREAARSSLQFRVFVKIILSQPCQW